MRAFAYLERDDRTITFHVPLDKKLLGKLDKGHLEITTTSDPSFCLHPIIRPWNFEAREGPEWVELDIPDKNVFLLINAAEIMKDCARNFDLRDAAMTAFTARASAATH